MGSALMVRDELTMASNGILIDVIALLLYTLMLRLDVRAGKESDGSRGFDRIAVVAL